MVVKRILYIGWNRFVWASIIISLGSFILFIPSFVCMLVFSYKYVEEGAYRVRKYPAATDGLCASTITLFVLGAVFGWAARFSMSKLN